MLSKRKEWTYKTVVVSVCLIVLGCTSMMSITAKNIGKTEIRTSQITSKDGFFFRPGIIEAEARSTKTYHGEVDKPASVYLIEWTDENGKQHKAEVDLSNKTRGYFKNGVVFEISESGVRAANP